MNKSDQTVSFKVTVPLYMAHKGGSTSYAKAWIIEALQKEAVLTNFMSGYPYNWEKRVKVLKNVR